jgi:hypothetical protein
MAKDAAEQNLEAHGNDQAKIDAQVVTMEQNLKDWETKIGSFKSGVVHVEKQQKKEKRDAEKLRVHLARIRHANALLQQAKESVALNQKNLLNCDKQSTEAEHATDKATARVQASKKAYEMAQLKYHLPSEFNLDKGSLAAKMQQDVSRAQHSILRSAQRSARHLSAKMKDANDALVQAEQEAKSDPTNSQLLSEMHQAALHKTTLAIARNIQQKKVLKAQAQLRKTRNDLMYAEVRQMMSPSGASDSKTYARAKLVAALAVKVMDAEIMAYASHHRQSELLETHVKIVAGQHRALSALKAATAHLKKLKQSMPVMDNMWYQTNKMV